MLLYAVFHFFSPLSVSLSSPLPQQPYTTDTHHPPPLTSPFFMQPDHSPQVSFSSPAGSPTVRFGSEERLSPHAPQTHTGVLPAAAAPTTAAAAAPPPPAPVVLSSGLPLETLRQQPWWRLEAVTSPSPPDRAGPLMGLVQQHEAVARQLGGHAQWGYACGGLDVAQLVQFVEGLSQQAAQTQQLLALQEQMMEEVYGVVQRHEAVLPDLPPETLAQLYGAVQKGAEQVGGGGASAPAPASASASASASGIQEAESRCAAAEQEVALMKTQVKHYEEEAERCRHAFAEYEATYSALVASVAAGGGGGGPQGSVGGLGGSGGGSLAASPIRPQQQTVAPLRSAVLSAPLELWGRDSGGVGMLGGRKAGGPQGGSVGGLGGGGGANGLGGFSSSSGGGGVSRRQNHVSFRPPTETKLAESF